MKLVAAWAHLYRKNEVLMHHRPLSKGFLVTRVVLLHGLATCLLNQTNVVHEGDRHLDVALHGRGSWVGYLKTKPVGVGRKAEVRGATVNRLPIGLRRSHIGNTQLPTGIDQHPHVRADIHALRATA